MEKGHGVTCKEQPYNVLKTLVTRRTHIENEEEDEDNAIATELTKIEKLVGKWMNKTWLKG